MPSQTYPTEYVRQHKAHSFLSQPVILHKNSAALSELKSSIEWKAKMLADMNFDPHRMAQFRSLLAAVDQTVDRPSSIIAARVSSEEHLVRIEQLLENRGAIRRCDSLTSDHPLRVDKRYLPRLSGGEERAPQDFVDEMEMNQRLLDMRRQPPNCWENINCRRGRVHEYLHLANLDEYAITLERGMVGPFMHEHLVSVDAFRKRHDEILQSERGDEDVRLNQKRQNDLLFVLSYRHKQESLRRFYKDRISDQDCAKLQEMLLFLWKETPRASNNVGVFFWQDQMASGQAMDNDLNWVNTGVIPYMVLPVLKIASELGIESDQERLWLTLEQLIGEIGTGLLIKEEHGKGHINSVPTFPSTLPDILRRCARSVVGGFLEGKEVTWARDFLRLNHWAIDVLLCETWDECVQLIQRQNVETDISINRRLTEVQLRTVLFNMNTFDGRLVDKRWVRVTARDGLTHTDWSDQLVIVETEGGETAGGISAPTLSEADVMTRCAGYEMYHDDEFQYYVRFPRHGFDANEVTTGRISVSEPHGSVGAGRVEEVFKVYVKDLWLDAKEIALDVVLLSKETQFYSACERLVDGSKEFFEKTSRAIAEQVWKKNGLQYIGSIAPSCARWQ